MAFCDFSTNQCSAYGRHHQHDVAHDKLLLWHSLGTLFGTVRQSPLAKFAFPLIISRLCALQHTFHHLLLKWPSFPSGINKDHLISPCEISHLTSIALQRQIAGGGSGLRYRIPVTATASVRPVSLHLPHKKHEALHCLTSAPAWRADACLICWEGGWRTEIPPSRQGNKSNGVMTATAAAVIWGTNERIKAKRATVAQEYEGRSTECVDGKKKPRHCNLFLRAHTDTQICLSLVPFSFGVTSPCLGCYSLPTHPGGLMSN